MSTRIHEYLSLLLSFKYCSAGVLQFKLVKYLRGVFCTSGYACDWNESNINYSRTEHAWDFTSVPDVATKQFFPCPKKVVQAKAIGLFRSKTWKSDAVMFSQIEKHFLT